MATTRTIEVGPRLVEQFGTREHPVPAVTRGVEDGGALVLHALPGQVHVVRGPGQVVEVHVANAVWGHVRGNVEVLRTHVHSSSGFEVPARQVFSVTSRAPP